MHFYHHRRRQRTPRKIAHLPLAEVVEILELPPASGALQLRIAALPPHPKLQGLGLFIDLMPVNPIPRPLQDLGEIGVSQSVSLANFPFL